MRVSMVLIAVLTVCLLAAGQTVVTSSNVATTQGVAIVPATPSAPMVATPIIHLGAAPLAVGASNATTGNQAGAVNSTLNMVSPASPVTIVPEISAPAAVIIQSPPPLENQAAAAAAAAAPNPGAPKILDRGVSRFNASVYRVGEMQGGRGSLGEIARQMRQRKGTLVARTYTNADIDRLTQQSGVTVMPGANQPANQPPASNIPPNTSGVLPPSTQPQQSQMQPMQGNQQAAMQPAAREQAEAQLPQSSSTAPASSQAAPAAPARRSQQAQANAPANEKNTAGQGGRERLPNSATALPLIALVGFVGVVVGVAFRRRPA